MRTRRRLLIPAIVSVVLLAGCGGDDVDGADADLERLDDDAAEDSEPIETEDADGADESTEGDVGLEVAIQDNAFVPPTLEIGVGDTVTWTHDGSRAHTVTSSDFDSGELSGGDVFEATFDEAGTVPYECTIHQGMAGEIVVS